MKKLLSILLLAITIVSLSSCGESIEDTSKNWKFLKGNHELRKFKTVTEEGYRMSGSYFLIAGSVSSGTYKNNKIA